jgi:hypothetical protein
MENLLVIEIKPWWNRTDLENDIQKIKTTWIEDTHYGYDFGLALLIGRTRRKSELHWFRKVNGKAEPIQN